MEKYRHEDAAEVLAAIKALKPPVDEVTEAELIAIAFVHEEPKVRSKAMAWIKKYVADSAELKSVFKRLHNVHWSEADARLRAIKRPDAQRIAIAKAMVAHGDRGQGIVFEADAEFMRSVLPRMIVERDGRQTLSLSEIQPYPGQEQYQTKGYGEMSLTAIPDAMFDAIGELRQEHPFEAVLLSASSIETLPERFAELGSTLRALTLQFNESMSSIPEMVFDFAELEALSVHSRTISTIPVSIGALKNLTKLKITHAKKIKKLPAELFGLDKLKLLSLREVGIKKLPAEISKLQALEELNLMDTPLKDLPKEVGQLPNLKKLWIRWSKIDAEQARAIIGTNVRLEA